MSNRRYRVFCDDDCSFEGMTKEQIITAIVQAVSEGEISNLDAGFITKVKEVNKNKTLSFWVGTSAEYESQKNSLKDVFCILTDDAIKEDLLESIENIVNGVTSVGSATDAVNVTSTINGMKIEDIFNEGTTVVKKSRRANELGVGTLGRLSTPLTLSEGVYKATIEGISAETDALCHASMIMNFSNLKDEYDFGLITLPVAPQDKEVTIVAKTGGYWLRLRRLTSGVINVSIYKDDGDIDDAFSEIETTFELSMIAQYTEDFM